MYTHPTIIPHRKFSDDRGSFVAQPIDNTWVQQNISTSHKYTFRGMHFQIGESAQAKYVQVLQGSVIDFVVPLEPLKNQQPPSVAIFHLSAQSPDNHQSLYVPKGFAHGFIALEDTTIFHYLVDAPYNPESERSIHFQSFPTIIQTLNTHHIDLAHISLSPKDTQAPTYQEWVNKNEPVSPIKI